MERVMYWILINGKRYVATENLKDAEFLIRYFKISGCKDVLEIEADLGGELGGCKLKEKKNENE